MLDAFLKELSLKLHNHEATMEKIQSSLTRMEESQKQRFDHLENSVLDLKQENKCKFEKFEKCFTQLENNVQIILDQQNGQGELDECLLKNQQNLNVDFEEETLSCSLSGEVISADVPKSTSIQVHGTSGQNSSQVHGTLAMGYKQVQDASGQSLIQLQEEIVELKKDKDFMREKLNKPMSDLLSGVESLKLLPTQVTGDQQRGITPVDLNTDVHQLKEELKVEFSQLSSKSEETKDQIEKYMQELKENNGRVSESLKEIKKMVEKNHSETRADSITITKNQSNLKKEMKTQFGKVAQSFEKVDDQILGLRHDYLHKIDDILAKVVEIQSETGNILCVGDEQTNRVSLCDVIGEVKQTAAMLKDEIVKMSTENEENREKINDGLAEVVEHITNEQIPDLARSWKIDVEKYFKSEMTNMAKVVNQAKDDTNTLIKGEMTKVSNDLNNAKNETKLKIAESNSEATQEMKFYVDGQLQFLIRDIYSVVEKESQLARQVIRKTGGDTRKVYDFYFRVLDFSQRVRSGVAVYSCPWFIQQLDTCLQGKVRFRTNGNLNVSLNDGRSPKLVGLQPRQKKSYKYKVCVVNAGDGKEKILSGETSGNSDESIQNVQFFSWGYNIGDFSCQQLVNDGFIYAHNLLLKDTITIV